MAKTLRNLLKTSLTGFVILLLSGVYNYSIAQISLQADRLTQLSFTEGQTRINDGSYRLSLGDIAEILAPPEVLNSSEWAAFESGESEGINSYIEVGTGRVAISNLQVKTGLERTIFYTAFVNEGADPIGSIHAAYDFISEFNESDPAQTIQLYYRVAGSDWERVDNGMISTGTLKSDKSGWSTFSLQVTLSEIYIKKADLIELSWRVENEIDQKVELPLALERIEILPKTGSLDPVEKGDLIITELFPITDVNGTSFEYVELFNPTEKPIGLKGIELHTSTGSVAIPKTITIEPYSLFILSNVDISSLETVSASYFYNGTIFEKPTGRLEIVQNGGVIASATYENARPGNSVELSSANRAYDGYSSMRDFANSEVSFFEDLNGSPGILGSTIPIMKKELLPGKSYLISLPGDISTRLSHLDDVKISTLDGQSETVAGVKPGNVYFFVNSGTNKATLYSTPDRIEHSRELDVRSIQNSQGIQIARYLPGLMVKDQGNRSTFSDISPVSLGWAADSEMIELQINEDLKSDFWSPVLLNSSLPVNQSKSLDAPVLSRYIEFNITAERGDDGATEADRAILGFFELESTDEDLRYDLPKLSIRRSENESQESAIYLASELAHGAVHSFVHLPARLSEEMRVQLGTELANNIESVKMQWNFTGDLPEEWILTLEDTQSGKMIDMREENQFEYRPVAVSNQQNPEAETDLISLENLVTENEPRFIIHISPYQNFSIEEEDEQPNSIELRPNYPNPFNPTTNINFFLPEERQVRVAVYNIVGQPVAVLAEDMMQPGEHSLLWDASDRPSGIYVVRLETGNRIFTRKITLIK